MTDATGPSDQTQPRDDALCTLRQALGQNLSFRASETAPYVQILDGHGMIECCSSGSTGTPKIIRRSLRSWTGSFAVNRALFGYTPADHIAVFGALSHSLALYGAAEALFCGLTPHLLGGLHPARQWQYLAQHRISVAYMTPTQLRIIRGDALPWVRQVICGGGILDQATRDHAAVLFPNARVTEFYGATETSFITLTDDTTPQGSVGRGYPGVTIDIRRASDGAGEVWVKSPYLFDRYITGNSPATQRAGDYLTVGEIGYLDANGYLFLRGRGDRMVTIADQNVHPEALESYLATLLPDRLSVVVTAPDALRGHQLAAYLEGPESSGATAWIRNAITQTLGPALVPRRFIWVDRVPLLASGKPDRKQLQRAHPWP